MDRLYVIRHEPTWREEPEPEPDDEYDTGTDTKTVYALFGLAIYKANVLEHTLVNTLAMARLITAAEHGERLISDPWAQGFKDMMGKLIRRAEPHVAAYPEVVDDLTRSLKRRNFLVHHFWRERIQETVAEAGRARLGADLRADCRLFAQTDERLTEQVFSPLAARRGITPEMITAQYARERQEAMRRYETDSFTEDEEPS